MTTSLPRQILIGILFGGAGFVLNWLGRVEIFQNATFLLGGVPVMFALLRYGPAAGITSAFLASCATWMVWGHPWGIVIFTAEAIAVAVLSRDPRIDALAADVLYWLVLGPVLVIGFHYGIMDHSFPSTLLEAMKLGVNGVFAILAAKIVSLSLCAVRPRADLRPSYRQVVHTVTLALILFPTLAGLILENRRLVGRERDLAVAEIVRDGELARALTETWLNDQHGILFALVAAIGDPENASDTEIQKIVELFRASSPAFRRLAVMNRDCVSVAAVPRLDEEGVSTIGVEYSGHPDLPALLRDLVPFAGDVMPGRSGDETPSLPLLAPFPVGPVGEFRGFCAGELALDRLMALLNAIVKEVGISHLTLLDRNRRVIASTRNELPTMTVFARPAGRSEPVTQEVSCFLADIDPGKAAIERWSRSYYFVEPRLPPSHGWTVLAERSMAPDIERLNRRTTNSFAILTICVVFLLPAAYLVSNQAARTVTTLRDIAEALPGRLAQVENFVWPVSLIREMDGLSAGLRRMADELKDRTLRLDELNQSLEGQVRRRTEELDEANRNLVEAQRLAHVGHWQFDAASNRLTWSDEIFHIVELDPRTVEPSADRFISLVHPADLARVARQTEPSTTVASYRLLMPDGRVKHVAEHRERERGGPQGAPPRILGTLQDVTAQVEAEERIRRATEEMKTFFQVSVDLLCIVDREGRFFRLNPMWEQTLGYPLAELIGRPYIELVHPDDVAATLAVGREALNKPVMHFTNRYRTRQGEWRWIDWRACPFEGFIYAAARDVTERRRLESALAERERLLRTIADGTSDAVFVKDREGRYRFFSAGAETSSGMTAAEVLGQDDTFLFPAESETIRDNDRRVMESGQVRTYEEHVTLQGKQVIFLATKGPVLDEQGQVTGMFGISRDITERRLMEEELRSSREYLAQLHAHLGEAVVVARQPDRVIEFVNPAVREIFGYDPEECVGRPTRELFMSEEEYQRYGVAVRDTFARGETTLRLEIDFRAKSGAAVPVLMTTSLPKGEGGRLERTISILRDISSMKETSVRLRENERRYRIVSEYTYDWEYWLNPDRRIEYMSPSCQRITGFAREEFLADPRKLVGIVHPDDQASFLTHLEREAEGLEICTTEFRILTRAGETRWLSHICQPIVEPDGTFLGRRASNRDITEAKTLQEERRRITERLETLYREVNHRVKNNLAAIVGLIHLEADRGAAGSSRASSLADLESRINSLLELHTLLSACNWEPVPVAELLDRVVRTAISPKGEGCCRPAISDLSGLRVGSEAANPLALIFNELATNTMKYACRGDDGCSIAIDLQPEGDRCRLVYRDSGPGYPMAVLAQGGVGLRSVGLTLVRGLTEKTLRGRLVLANDLGAVTELILRRDLFL